MKHLISNSLNEKSVINNILSGTLNKLIILTGTYGTGKSVFGTEIGRMLICQNFTKKGYCGECDSCKSEIVSGISSFNSEIHLLNMKKVTYEDMQVLVNQAVGKVRTRNEIYILDEFHLVDKKIQELWLAETAKLEDCYIIMTTTDKRSVSDGIISRSIQISMKTLAPLESTQLIKEHYPDASKSVIEALVKKIGGVPRELINMSNYYNNSGLTQEEILEHLGNVNQQEIILCLESLTNRELFFDTLRTVRTLNSYSIKKSLQDILWDWLGATESDRIKITYLSHFNQKQIMRFLVTSNEDALLTILNMFDTVTIKKPINEDLQSLNKTGAEQRANKGEKFEKLESW